MKENGQLSDAMDCGFYVHDPRFLWPVSNPGFYNMAYAGSGITSEEYRIVYNNEFNRRVLNNLGKFRHNTDWQGE